MSTPTCPMTRTKVVETYFMEHRAKLIDIAAFLDRLDRTEATGDRDDFRVEAFKRAIAILSEDAPGRTQRILELFSDHSRKPIASAADMKGAFGADRGPTP